MNKQEFAFEIGDEVRLKEDEGLAHGGPDDGNNGAAVIKALLSPDIKGGLFLEKHLRGVRYWNEEDVLWTQRQALRKALNWIDKVPLDTVLPAMPGFDREWVENLLSDNPCPHWAPLSYAQGISMALEWIDAIPAETAAALAASGLPALPRAQIEASRDTPELEPLAHVVENDDSVELGM